MNLVIGVVLLWVGSALLYIATHATGASTPWDAYSKILDGIGGTAGETTKLGKALP